MAVFSLPSFPICPFYYLSITSLLWKVCPCFYELSLYLSVFMCLTYLSGFLFVGFVSFIICQSPRSYDSLSLLLQAIFVSVRLSVCLFVWLIVWVSLCLSHYLSITSLRWTVCPFFCLFICFRNLLLLVFVYFIICQSLRSMDSLSLLLEASSVIYGHMPVYLLT